MTARADAGFVDRLAVTLTLTIAGARHAIPGGSVKQLTFDLRSYGFTGELVFVIQDDLAHGGGFTDELITAFLQPDLIEVALQVAAVHVSPEAGVIEPIALAALVTDKSVSEVVFRETKGSPVLIRRYRIAFADPAHVLWGQHFPCQLYTDKSMTAVIDDHRGDKIAIAYDFSELGEPHRLVFLHLPRTAGASFRDFVAWYLDGCAGVLLHDYAAASYQIAAAKPEAGTAVQLFGDDLDTAELHLADVPRHAPVVRNTSADSVRSESIAQPQAAAGIRSDILLRTAIAQDVDDRVALERKRTVLPCYEAHLAFARMPSCTLVPGTLVALSAANRWSSESALVGVTWRVRRVRLHAEAPQRPLDHELQLASTGYHIELTAELEQAGDPRRELPPFRAPSYPGLVEGKVVSEQGQDGDKTYQVYRDRETSLDEYRIKVPLWDNQIVAAPFEPVQGSGNMYRPSYRDERVLLAIDVHAARIARLIAWRPGARLAMDVQGEHLLFGKSDDTKTSLNHVYDGDNPVFNVARTHHRDTSRITLSEGALFLEVKEQD